MELKEMLEKIRQARKLNGELYEQGVIDTGKDYTDSSYPRVHLTNELFFKVTVDYKKRERKDEYDELYEVIDGIEYFTLIEKGEVKC